VGGVALRVWDYRSELGVPDSDEAVVGLMALHLLDGEWTTFFWGQGFGGSQEALLTAPVFWLAGPSWLALRVVPIILTAIAALVVWRVGRRTIGEPAATFAGCLAWIWPPFAVHRLTHQFGFYASGVLYSALLLLLGLRLVERPSRARAGAFGLVLGLALWQSAQVLPVAVGVVVWTIWKQPAWLRQLWIAVLLAIVGALPSIVWNVRHDWGSLESTIENTTSYAHRLRVFLSPLLGMLLGLRTPYTQERLLPTVATFTAYAALAGLFAYGAYRSRHRAASLLYVVAAIFPFVYAAAPQTLFVQEPRYLLVLSPVVTLLVAQLATTYWRGVVVLAAALAVSIATLERMETYAREVPAQPPKAPRDLGPLVATLDALRLDRVYADFWLSYRLTFETDERIVAAQSKLERVGVVNGDAIPARHPFSRHRPYERLVESGRHGFVFFRSSLAEGADRTPGPAAEARVEQLATFVAELRRLGYRTVEVGPFVVFARGSWRPHGAPAANLPRRPMGPVPSTHAPANANRPARARHRPPPD
jgi:Dolichyl-phosphate-mannose-protein mannosyltransferase